MLQFKEKPGLERDGTRVGVLAPRQSLLRCDLAAFLSLPRSFVKCSRAINALAHLRGRREFVLPDSICLTDTVLKPGTKGTAVLQSGRPYRCESYFPTHHAKPHRLPEGASVDTAQNEVLHVRISFLRDTELAHSW